MIGKTKQQNKVLMNKTASIFNIKLASFFKKNYSHSNLLISIIIITSITIDIIIERQLLVIPLISGLVISSLVIRWGIYKLNKYKIKQFIRKDGPREHFQKSGTPSMGGIFIVPTSLII